MTYTFDKRGDYKSAFAAEVDALWATDINARIGEFQSDLKRFDKLGINDDKAVGGVKLNIALLFAQKNRIADDLTEAYVRDIGERPDGRQLDRLATWLLKGAEHDDANADVLTATQRYRRNKRELPDMLVEEKITNTDGNTFREPKPSMDGKGSHFEYVRMPNDNEDKRKFNGPLRRYNVNFDGKK